MRSNIYDKLFVKRLLHNSYPEPLYSKCIDVDTNETLCKGKTHCGISDQ